MSRDQTSPPVPLALGLAGLTPFIALTLLLKMDAGGLALPGTITLRGLLVAYAVAILSFLGGIRWGLAMGMDDPGSARRAYLMSVVPSILAWVAVALPEPWDLRALAGLMVLVGIYDYGLVCRCEAPEWFGRLRLMLTAVVGSLLIAAGW